MMVNQEEALSKREPIKLLKNRRYPTFQLYAEVNNDRTDPIRAFKLAVLETMAWARKRFRELDLPPQLNFPPPKEEEDVDIKDFQSFRVNRGYVLEVVYIDDLENGKLIWSLHLMEPDLGPEPGNPNQKRQPVAGRVFETNISFLVDRGRLECGFKTMCSEPEGVDLPCEVFRMAVVKNIVRNKDLGLRQIYPIIEEAHQVNSLEKTRRLRAYINNEERQLPIILVAEYKEEADFPSLLTNKAYYTTSNSMTFELEDRPIKVNGGQVAPAIDLKELAKLRMGYGQFFLLELDRLEEYNRINPDYKISKGDIRIIHPLNFNKKSKLFEYEEIKRNRIFEEYLADLVQDYPKYKTIDYKNIKFYTEARLEEQERVVSMSTSKEELSNYYENALEDLSNMHKEEVERLEDLIHYGEETITDLREKLRELENKLADRDSFWKDRISQILGQHDKEKRELERQVERKDLLLKRPRKLEEVAQWVEECFYGRLIFHTRAMDMIKKVKPDEIDLDLLCDALEFLAYEYRDERIGSISEEERNLLCHEKYNRPFIVTPSGDKSIEYYSNDYKIKYKKRDNGKLAEVVLDLHLKVGNSNDKLLRIYFHYDRDKDLVVIGSLPYHLKSVYKSK